MMMSCGTPYFRRWAMIRTDTAAEAASPATGKQAERRVETDGADNRNSHRAIHEARNSFD